MQGGVGARKCRFTLGQDQDTKKRGETPDMTPDEFEKKEKKNRSDITPSERVYGEVCA